MQDGKNLGDVEVVKQWLRKVHRSYEFLYFEPILGDGSVLSTCENDPSRIQLYNCVEHIAHILQLPILYHITSYGSMEVIIEFEGVKYFTYTSKENLYDGD